MHLCFIFDREGVTSVHPFCDEGHNSPPHTQREREGRGAETEEQRRQTEERGRQRPRNRDRELSDPTDSQQYFSSGLVEDLPLPI